MLPLKKLLALSGSATAVTSASWRYVHTLYTDATHLILWWGSGWIKSKLAQLRVTADFIIVSSVVVRVDCAFVHLWTISVIIIFKTHAEALPFSSTQLVCWSNP